MVCQQNKGNKPNLQTIFLHVVARDKVRKSGILWPSRIMPSPYFHNQEYRVFGILPMPIFAAIRQSVDYVQTGLPAARAMM
jgi:hypothetical protein